MRNMCQVVESVRFSQSGRPKQEGSSDQNLADPFYSPFQLPSRTYHRGRSHATLYYIYPTHGLHQELECKLLKVALVVLQRKACVSCKRHLEYTRHPPAIHRCWTWCLEASSPVQGLELFVHPAGQWPWFRIQSRMLNILVPVMSE